MFVTLKVSGITSKETISFSNSITVKQTPLTEILAPFSSLLRKVFETLTYTPFFQPVEKTICFVAYLIFLLAG